MISCPCSTMIDWARRLSRLSLPYFSCNERHVDRTLVVSDHHACEVAVGVAARRNPHACMHAGIHAAHLAMESRLRSAWPIAAQRIDAHVIADRRYRDSQTGPAIVPQGRKPRQPPQPDRRRRSAASSFTGTTMHRPHAPSARLSSPSRSERTDHRPLQHRAVEQAEKSGLTLDWARSCPHAYFVRCIRQSSGTLRTWAGPSMAPSP